jgi:hypothetical protein
MRIDFTLGGKDSIARKAMTLGFLAKFTQDLRLKKMLLATKDAQLWHIINRSPNPEYWDHLMRVRDCIKKYDKIYDLKEISKLPADMITEILSKNSEMPIVEISSLKMPTVDMPRVEISALKMPGKNYINILPMKEYIFIYGNTFPIKEKIKELGGKFIKNLEKVNSPGWGVPLTKVNEIKLMVESFNDEISLKEDVLRNKKKIEKENKNVEKEKREYEKKIKEAENEIQKNIIDVLKKNLISLPLVVSSSTRDTEIARNKIVLYKAYEISEKKLDKDKTDNIIYLLRMYSCDKNLKVSKFDYDDDGNISWYFQTNSSYDDVEKIKYYSSFADSVNIASEDNVNWKKMYEHFFPMCMGTTE